MHTLENLLKAVTEQLSTTEPAAGPLLLLCLILAKGATYETGKQLAALVWRWLTKHKTPTK